MTPQYSVILSKLAEDKFDKLIRADSTLFRERQVQMAARLQF